MSYPEDFILKNGYSYDHFLGYYKLNKAYLSRYKDVESLTKDLKIKLETYAALMFLADGYVFEKNKFKTVSWDLFEDVVELKSCLRSLGFIDVVKSLLLESFEYDISILEFKKKPFRGLKEPGVLKSSPPDEPIEISNFLLLSNKKLTKNLYLRKVFKYLDIYTFLILGFNELEFKDLCLETQRYLIESVPDKLRKSSSLPTWLSKKMED